jgi:deoxyribodipyrimidine photo-lyase
VPELAALPGAAAHEPWRHGGAPGYPAPIVEHAAERREALARLADAGPRNC